MSNLTAPEISPLTRDSFYQALQQLALCDKDLAGAIAAVGDPPFWVREPGFATLVQIILEQQVSLASAKAVFNRLAERVNPLTPENFLKMSDLQLAGIGFSKQKLAYCRHLAGAIENRSLNLTAVAGMEQKEALDALTGIKGIGPWTAEIYLLLALRHPDIMPASDLALLSAVKAIKGLPVLPTSRELLIIAEAWKPWRSVAARLLWHFYLTVRIPGKNL